MAKKLDLTGQRFGRGVVIESAGHTNGSRARAQWLCQCDCGNTYIATTENLRAGNTQSCGCLQKERAQEANLKHGQTDSRLYVIWCSMKERCYNSHDPQYHNYGERGIEICDEWKNNYPAFMEWANANGYDETAPRGKCTIDRIDTNKGYSPDNCRWADMKTQMRNVRYNHYETYNGETLTIAEWAERYNILYSTLLPRINEFGYTIEEALTLPLHSRLKEKKYGVHRNYKSK